MNFIFNGEIIDYDFYLNKNKKDIQLEAAKELLNAKN